MGESSCHPALLLQDVLEVMFRKLRFEELKKCRRVCRTWEEASRKLVKSRSQLRLNGSIRRNLDVVEFLRRDFHFFIPSKLKIDLSSNSQWRAENLKELGNHDESGDRLHQELEDIYGILGRHSFEELEIYGFDRNAHPEIPDHLLKMLGQVATLNSAQCFIPGTGQKTLDVCPLLTKLSIADAPEWLHNTLLSACPNLTEINANSYYPVSVLEKSSGGLRKISGFTCAGQKGLEVLKRKSGDLTELSLKLEERVGESVLEFAQTKRESLTLLKLRFLQIPETLRLGRGFNQLEKLQLEIGNYYPVGIQCLLEICFSRDTPQLKFLKLELFGVEQNWKDLLAYKSNTTNAGRVIPLRTLSHLDLSVGGRVDRECADYLRQLFPSLTSFKIKRPTEDFLRGLWQMGNLLVIGIDLTNANKTTGHQVIEDLDVALFGTTREDQEVQESILNLKKLRYLRIHNIYWNRGARMIPEEIVRNGFGNMRSLAILKLGSVMTPEGCGFLKANLPYLRRLEHYGHSACSFPH